MTYEELLAIARRSKGKTLRTIKGREFQVDIYLDCPFFIPASTGMGRSDGRKAAERFLEIYNRTGSPKTTSYRSVTINASYYLVLLNQ